MLLFYSIDKTLTYEDATKNCIDRIICEDIINENIQYAQYNRFNNNLEVANAIDEKKAISLFANTEYTV